MLDMSTTSFLAELRHIKESTLSNPLLQDNSKSSPDFTLVRFLLTAKFSDTNIDVFVG
jgi:hypothetical protein